MEAWSYPGSSFARVKARLGAAMPSWWHRCVTIPTRVYAKRALRAAARDGGELSLVLGAEGRFRRAWIPIEIEMLDITSRDAWLRWFEPGSVARMLAEHVWEHLTLEEARAASENCFEFLAPGGNLRVAVPDGNHPDPGYRRWVEPGGVGPGAHGHRVLHTVESLEAVLADAGFEVTRLEYFDRDGRFHHRAGCASKGRIARSRLDARNRDGALRYTSIILDAAKDGAGSARGPKAR